jgi:hypothetical protein
MLDLDSLRSLVQPFVIIFSALIVSGASSSIAVQILKLDWFPLLISRSPRLTNAIVSTVASLVAIYASGVQMVLVTPFQYAAFIIGTIVLSAFTYKVVLKGTTAKDGRSSEMIG